MMAFTIRVPLRLPIVVNVQPSILTMSPNIFPDANDARHIGAPFERTSPQPFCGEVLFLKHPVAEANGGGKRLLFAAVVAIVKVAQGYFAQGLPAHDPRPVGLGVIEPMDVM